MFKNKRFCVCVENPELSQIQDVLHVYI